MKNHHNSLAIDRMTIPCLCHFDFLYTSFQCSHLVVGVGFRLGVRIRIEIRVSVSVSGNIRIRVRR